MGKLKTMPVGLLLCITLLVSGCAQRTVEVVDSRGNPVAGARVDAVSLSITASKFTGADGKTMLPDNVQQARWVAVSKPGFQSTQVNLPAIWPLRIVLSVDTASVPMATITTRP